MVLDPVDYAVISQGLLAAAREMGSKLIRSAYSTIVREARDASAAILDRQGNVVAQAELIPMQLGAIADTIRPCLEHYPIHTLQENDFLINNHPYFGGQHLQDIYIFSPIFIDGGIIGFAASVAHHLDLGGGHPGLNMSATDLYQEGIIIPPLKLNEDRDWNGGPFERMMEHNCRVPWQTIGDINAQMAGNAIGIHRVKELSRRYGRATVEAAMDELISYSERRIRLAIAAAPDGIYHGEDAVDDDGRSPEALPVKVSVDIRGDEISLDFEGTAPEVWCNLNSPLSSTVSAVFSCVKMVLSSPDIPFNEGLKRPIRISVPKGTILNPKFPAPVRARIEACYAAYNATMKAFAQAVPDKVTAPGFDRGVVNCLSHLGEEGFRVYIEVFSGGFGAGPSNDGCSAVDGSLSNCSNTPVEALDMEFKYFRVTEYSLKENSFGHGKHRGGLGLVRRYEILKDDVSFAIYADRFRLSADGIFGGTSGQCASAAIQRGDATIEVRSKDTHMLRKGDVLKLITGGGGGYGDPDHRNRDMLRDDLREGLMTEDTARTVYSVPAAGHSHGHFTCNPLGERAGAGD